MRGTERGGGGVREMGGEERETEVRGTEREGGGE